MLDLQGTQRIKICESSFQDVRQRVEVQTSNGVKIDE